MIVVQVLSSNCFKSLELRGQGKLTSIRFEPALCELGPILPGTQMAEMEVTMINMANRAVEVYSADFDDKYLQDEEMLRTCTNFDADGYLRIPVRQPGDPFPKFIIDSYARATSGDPIEGEWQ